MTRQVSVEVSTRGGAEASLLVQQLDGFLSLVDSLHMSAGVRLTAIPSGYEALSNLGTFAFVASPIFSAGWRHSSAVTELLRLIKRLEERHTEVQEMVSSPHIATTLLYDGLRRWIQCINRCVDVLDSEVVEAPGGRVPFFLEPILVELEGGRYIEPILPTSLADLVAGRWSEGDGATRGS